MDGIGEAQECDVDETLDKKISVGSSARVEGGEHNREEKHHESAGDGVKADGAVWECGEQKKGASR